MPTLEAVIVENNEKDGTLLKKILKDQYPHINVVGEAYTVAAAKELFLKQPHLAFMAIELTWGTSFDVLSHLNQTGSIDFDIVFIANNQRYDDAIKAIDFSPIALLNKPIDPDILRGVIEKAKENQDRKKQVQQMFDKLQTLDEHDTHIIINSVHHIKVAVAVADITHFKAEGQTTVIHFQDGSSLIAFSILGYFKKMLLDKHAFYLVHNSLLVNTHQIKSFKYAELEITLKNGKKLIASRRYGKEFKKYWEEFN